MTKFLKKTAKIFGWATGAFILILFLLYLLFRSPKVQTYVTQKVTAQLSQSLNTKIDVQGVDIAWLNRIQLEGFYIEDQRQDTLLYARELSARVSAYSLFGNYVYFSAIGGSDIKVRLKRSATSSSFNYQFLVEALRSEEKRSTIWRLNLNQLEFDHLRFSYYDEHLPQLLRVTLPNIRVFVNDIAIPGESLHVTNIEIQQPNTELIRPAREFEIPDSAITNNPLPEPWDIRVNRLKINQGQFSYQNQSVKDSSTAGINFQDLHVHSINLLSQNIQLNPDSLVANVKQVALQEQSGFEINKFNTDLTITPTLVDCQRFTLQTPHSTLGHHLSFKYDRFADFRKFPQNVRMKANLSASEVYFRDIGYFAPPFLEVEKTAKVDGVVSGTLEDFHTDQLEILTEAGGRIRGQLTFRGLPDIDRTYMSFTVEQARIQSQELRQYLSFVQFPPVLDKFGTMDFTGHYNGFYYDFVADGTFSTALGEGTTDLQIAFTDSTIKKYNGEIAMTNFDLGRLLEVPQLGKVTLSGVVQGEGAQTSTLSAELNARAKKFVYEEYPYQDVMVQGEFYNSQLDGQLTINDPHCQVQLKGKADYSTDKPEYDFQYNIKALSTRPLHLTTLPYQFQSEGSLQFKGHQLNEIEGTAQLNNTTIQRQSKSTHLSRISLSNTLMNGQKEFHLESDYLNGQISGTYRWEQIPGAFRTTLDRYMSYTNYPFQRNRLVEDSLPPHTNMKFDLQLAGEQEWVSVLYPGLSIPKSAQARGHLDVSKGLLRGEVQVPQISYYQYDAYGVEAHFRDRKEQLEVKGHMSELYDQGRRLARKIGGSATLMGDTLLSAVYLGPDTARHHISTQLIAHLQPEQLDVRLKNSTLILNHKPWQINPDHLVVMADSTIRFHNFAFEQGQQKLGIEGVLYNRSQQKKAQVTASHFSLYDLNTLFQWTDRPIDGEISGQLTITQLYPHPIFETQAEIPKLIIQEQSMGPVRFTASHQTSEQIISLSGSIGYQLKMKGTYNYASKVPSPLDLSGSLQQFPLPAIEPFVDKFVSNLNGTGSGRFQLTGSFNNPKLEGQLQIENGVATIDYLQTRYWFSDQIEVSSHPEKGVIAFRDFQLKDPNGHSAYLNGTINHQYLKDFTLNLHLDAHEFLSLNTKPQDNEPYYGTVIGTGTVTFTGPLKHPKIDVDGKTLKGTKLFIPITEEYQVERQEFITFKSPPDSVKKKGAEETESTTGPGVHFICNVNITPEAQTQIMLGGPRGDIIRSRGQSDLKLEITPNGDFSMYGNYSITEGDYAFTFQNVINKNFKLEENSTISWQGEPYKAQMNVRANYSLRTTIRNLLKHAQTTIDTSEKINTSRRVPVDCHLLVSGDLGSPNINFDITVPQEFSDAEIEQALNIIRSNQQELNRQVASLLMLNTFLPPQQGGKGASWGQYGASAANRSVSDFVSGQLSQMASKAIKGLDVGVNYQTYKNKNAKQAADKGAGVEREVQVQMSKRIFDDRVKVEVGGNVYLGKGTSQDQQFSGDNLAGDFNIEYEISEGGNFRGRVFNRSANELGAKNINKRGVGLSYRQQFDSLRELWNKISNSSDQKKSKEEGGGKKKASQTEDSSEEQEKEESEDQQKEQKDEKDENPTPPSDTSGTAPPPSPQ